MKYIVTLLLLSLVFPSVCMSRSTIEQDKVEYTKCMKAETKSIVDHGNFVKKGDEKETTKFILIDAHSNCSEEATQIEVTLTEIGYDDPDTHKKFFEWMNRYHEEYVFKKITGERAQK